MRSTLALCSLWFVLGCATGNELVLDDGSDDGEGGAPGSGGGPSSDGGAGSGPSGNGGQTGGQGGATSSSSSVTGGGPTSNSSSSSTTGSGGGPGSNYGHVLMLEGGGSSLVGSIYQVPGGSGWSTPWLTSTFDPVAIEVTPGGVAFGLFRASGDGSLGYVFWSGGNQWSQLVSLAPGVSTAGPPRTTNDGVAVHIGYLTTSGAYGYSQLNGGVFVSNESVGAPASVGVSSPALASIGAGTLFSFVGADGDLHDRVRDPSGVWTMETAHGLPSQVAPIAPALAVPATGPDAVMVFVKAGTNMLASTTRTGDSWSAPIQLGAASADPPALTLLDSGELLLAYRGTDQKGYTATWNGTTFDPAEPILSPNPTILCTPAIATGAIGAEAELVYLDELAVAYWSRRQSGVFGPGVLSGLASPPSCTAIAVAP